MFPAGKTTLHIKALSGCIIVLLLFAILSCEKEKSTTDPTIEVIRPSSMVVYELGDTIPVHVIIKHNLKLDFVKLSLRSESGLPYEPIQEFNVDSTYFELKTYIVIQNVMIKEGKSYVQISTTDEKRHTSLFYLPVTIAEVPRRLKAAIFLVRQSNQRTRIQSITPSGIIDELVFFNGPENGEIALTSSNQNMFYVDGEGRGLSAFNISLGELKWTISEPENPVQWPFQSLYTDDTIAYVFKAQGYINGYNSEQMVVFHTEKFEHGIFTHITRFGRFVAACFKPINTGLTKLYLFNSPGGTVYREISFKGEVLYLATYDRSRMILFLKQDGKIKVYHYDIQLNTLVYSMELPFGEALEITGKGEDHYFVIHGDELWWVRPEINSAVNFLQYPGLHNVAYDALDNHLFIGAGNKICLYQLPQVVPLFEYVTTGEVTRLDLLYNR